MNNKTKIIAVLVGIIAVAFVYTIAVNLQQGYKAYDYTAKKVLQAYNEINTALYEAQDKYGNFNEWSAPDASDKEKLEVFMQNMNIGKKIDCGINDSSEQCWWNKDLLHYNYKGKTNPIQFAYTFVDKHENLVYVYHNNYWGYLMVYDINGKKGPNTRGKDIYYFQTGPDNVEFVPGGEDQLGSNNRLRNGCFKNGCCCAWVIRTGNSEHLKVNKDGYCQNGKRLSWFNTFCK